MIKYWFWKVPRRAARTWFVDIIWSNFGWALLLGFLASILPVLWQALRGDSSALLTQWREHPMNSLYNYFLGGEGVVWVAAAVAVGYLLCALFVAPQQIHSEQLIALNDARTELASAVEEIKANRPQITGEIFSLFSGRFTHTSSDVAWVIVSVWVMLRNTGEPSIAEDFVLHAMTVDGRELRGLPALFSDDTPLKTDEVLDPAEQALAQPSEQLSLKTLIPIPKGGAVGGSVIAVFPIKELEALQTTGCRFAVTFFDVHRKPLSCQYTLKGERQLEPGTAGFIPGRPIPKANPDSKQ